ncbi:hypothetical protein [Lichenibacterium ramalinae]|uniref:Amidohydrolase-related domain-containing protein n=1 Tax=Lichenibacterium ramalinae TaxID=2316527 RepID=A0A4Q2R5D4_9HYPH|nr:hypothetical protein [Lichenibacterium ramalinae]RYB01562.1 hypothetical protein D3272_25570 [Lichenibacterium ramalinae]
MRFASARLDGLSPRKGAIEADADIAAWDPPRRVTRDLMHHGSDDTPFAGWEVAGWPVTTSVGGRVVVDDGQVVSGAGHGAFVPRGFSDRRAPPEAG